MLSSLCCMKKNGFCHIENRYHLSSSRCRDTTCLHPHFRSAYSFYRIRSAFNTVITHWMNGKTASGNTRSGTLLLACHMKSPFKLKKRLQSRDEGAVFWCPSDCTSPRWYYPSRVQRVGNSFLSAK